MVVDVGHGRGPHRRAGKPRAPAGLDPAPGCHLCRHDPGRYPGAIVSWLERWIPRTLAVILVYLALILVLAGIFWVLVPPLVGQIQALVDRLPELVDRGEQLIESWQRMAGGALEGSLGGVVTGALGPLGSAAASVPAAIAGALTGAALVIIVSIYWLILSPRISQ